MQTLLVTGGAGFIGSNFVLRSLASRDDLRVINLDALTYAGNRHNLASLSGDDRHRFVEGDIRDAGLVAALLEAERPDAIVHFAAESHVDRSIDGPAEFVDTNVVGTLNLLQRSLEHWRSLDHAGRDAFRFLQVSTDEVYGSLGPEGKFSETSPYQPNSPYAASKAAADHLVRAFHHTYGLPVLTSNCSNNYGPLQFPEKLIPLVLLRAQAGQTLPVYGDGQQVRDWLYVEDHADALWRVLEDGRVGQVYNIGGDSERTNLEVVEALCDLLDERAPWEGGARRQLIEFVTDRPGHDRRYAIDASRMRDELGWTPGVTFDEGLAQTVDWYLGHPEWVETVQSGAYRQERLGLGDESSGGAAA